MNKQNLNLCNNCKAVYTPLLFCAYCASHNQEFELENQKYKRKKENIGIEKELYKYRLPRFNRFQLSYYDIQTLNHLLQKTKKMLIADGYLSGQ